MATHSRISAFFNRLLQTAVIVVCLLFLHATVSAQNEPNLAPFLQLVKSGNMEILKEKLPELVRTYPDNAGVLYLQGLAEPDGDKAIQFFQSIVNLHAGSEWADDAMYRLYQYHYAIGAYNTADKYLSKLKMDFPKSPYLSREDKPEEQEKSRQQAESSGGYSVQVAAFTSRDDAEAYLEEMKKIGYTAELRDKTIEKKKVFAVWLGIFPASESAKSFARKLKQRHNIDAIVVRR